MHDSKGREIHEGDVIAAKDYSRGGKRSPFFVVGTNPGAQSCNVAGMPCRHPASAPYSFNANEVEIVLKHDGQLPGCGADTLAKPVEG